LYSSSFGIYRLSVAEINYIIKVHVHCFTINIKLLVRKQSVALSRFFSRIIFCQKISECQCLAYVCYSRCVGCRKYPTNQQQNRCSWRSSIIANIAAFLLFCIATTSWWVNVFVHWSSTFDVLVLKASMVRRFTKRVFKHRLL